jgi:hypothetical protein
VEESRAHRPVRPGRQLSLKPHEQSSKANELSSNAASCSHRRGPARGVLRARLADRVTARPSAEAQPRRGDARRREPAHVRGDSAGAVTAPVRRGAVVRRRRAGATSQRPGSRRALPVQPRDQLQGSCPAGPCQLHRRVERRRSSTSGSRRSSSRHTGAGPFRNNAAMSGALPSLPSAHDMAASSAGAGAHGRSLDRRNLVTSA